MIAWGLVMIVSLLLLHDRVKIQFAARSKHKQRIFFQPRYDVLAVPLLIWLINLFIVALAAPPNTFDSMTYHMSRVAHWLQNEHVGLYPTGIIRQLTYPPLAEYTIAHLQALSGGDRLANLVQFSALLGCLLGTSWISQRFGVSRRGQWFTAVLVATLPMAVLQSTSTQNDLVLSFWLVCLVAFILDEDRLKFGSWTVDRRLMVGLSLGLAMLTKYTGYIYGVPLLVWFTYRLWRDQRSFGPVLRSIIFVVFVALLLNVTHLSKNAWLRLHSVQLSEQLTEQIQQLVSEEPELNSGSQGLNNASQDGSVDNGRLHIPIPSAFINQYFDPQAVISNILRNLVIHLGTPWEIVNRQIDAFIWAVHDSMNVSVGEPLLTFPPDGYKGVDFSGHEDQAGNFVHTAILIGLLTLWAGRKAIFRSSSQKDVLELAAALILCALTFIVILKWQPWHSRLHLPLFVLAMPLVTTQLAFKPWGAAAMVSLGFIMFFLASPFLMLNRPRPLVGSRSVLIQAREVQYFSNQKQLEAPFRYAAQYIRQSGCDDIGLMLNGNRWEYPLWVLLGKHAGKEGDLNFQHVEPANYSKSLIEENIDLPCLIVKVPGTDENIVLREQTYNKIQFLGDGLVSLHQP